MPDASYRYPFLTFFCSRCVDGSLPDAQVSGSGYFYCIQYDSIAAAVAVCFECTVVADLLSNVFLK